MDEEKAWTENKRGRQIKTKRNCLRFANPAEAELRTSVYPSNFAPIPTKLRENAFRMICNFRFFDAENFFSKFCFRLFSLVFSRFSADFGGARFFFGRQNQVPRGILLQIHLLFRSVPHLEPFFEAKNVFHRTLGMSSFEHKECRPSNTGNVVLRTQGMSFFEHKECLSSNTRNILLRTQGLSFFEHKELSFLEYKERPSSNTRIHTKILMRCNPFTKCN